MNIDNIQAFITKGLIAEGSQIDPSKTFVQIGVYQPGNRQIGAGNANTYKSYAISIAELLSGASITADNGLSVISSVIELGGTLSKNTDIDLDGYTLIWKDGSNVILEINSGVLTLPQVYGDTTYTGGYSILGIDSTGKPFDASLVITTQRTVKDFGAVGDGVTDDTLSIQDAFDNGVGYFPNGTYISSNLLVNYNNLVIEGESKSTIIKATNAMTGYLINADGSCVYVKNITLEGKNITNYSGTATIGTQSGIFLNILTPKQMVYNVDFTGFDNIALGLNGNIIHQGDGLVVDSCSFIYNSVALDTGPGGVNKDSRLNGTNGAEYISIVNNIFKYCRYAYIGDSGNQTATGNVISDNYYGFYVNGAAANSGHSSFTGNISNSNAFNLFVKDCVIGYSISGNQFFSGNLTLENSAGIVITNNTFGGVSTIRFYLGGGNTFAYNWFYTNPTLQNISLLGTEIHSNYILGTGYMSNRSPLIVDVTGTTSSGIPTGPELVTNGSFTTNTDWIQQAGWSIGSGSANGAAVTGYLYQALGATIFGANLVVTYTVSNYVSGSVNFSIGGGSQSTIRTSNGTYTESVIGGIGGGTEIYFLGTAFTGSIDNVSVKVGTFNPLPVGDFVNGHFKAAKISRTTLPPIYINNASALAGGLVVGEEYRSGTDPDILYIVH